MDDELALLQQQLAAIQQQETSLKLSDHNIIDLLSKLSELFPPEQFQVIHTLTAKQIVTPKRLMQEIQENLLLYRGRISVNELAQLINVDRFYIEKYAAQLAKDSRKSADDRVFVVNSGEEVITNWYLDAIMEDTNAVLQEKGTMSIGELAQQYDFAVEHMREVIMTRLGTILKAQEHLNCLVTDTFVQSQKARIRGLMCGITRPMFLPEMARAYGLDDKIMQETVQELISSDSSSKTVWGALRGKEYVPLVFLDKQKENLFSFFEQNGYIDQPRACDMLQISRPFDLLQKRFGKDQVIALKQSCVNSSLKILLEAAIENASNERSFCDLRNVVPGGLPPSDLESLISNLPTIKASASSSSALLATPAKPDDRQVFQIHRFYVVAREFFDAVLEKLKQDAKVEASKAAQDHRTVTSESRANDALDQEDGDYDDDEPSSRKGARKGGKKQAAASATRESSKKASKRGGRKKNHMSDDEQEDTEEVLEERGTSKPKKKQKQKQTSKRQSTTSAAGSGKRGGASNKPRSTIPNHEKLVELFIQVHEELADEDPDFVDALVDFLQDETERIYQEALASALSSILRGDAAALRELRKKFDELFDEKMALLSIYEKAFLKLEHLVTREVHEQQEELEQSLKQVEAFLLDSCGVELSGFVMAFVMESFQLELDDCTVLSKVLLENHDGGPSPKLMVRLSDANKKLLEQQLQASMASALVRMWTLSVAGRRSLGDFMAHLSVLAQVLNMPMHKMDRKKERQVVFGQRHLLVAALEEAQQAKQRVASAAVSFVLQLFFQQVTGLCLKLPDDSPCYQSLAELVLTALQRNVSPEAIERLKNFVSTLTRVDENAQEDAADVEWNRVLEEAKTLVLSKDLCKEK